MIDRDRALPLSALDTEPFAVGHCSVLPVRNLIVCSGTEAAVEPRIMHVLVCLAHRAGDVVTRTALLDTVWNGTFVQEEALTHAVSQLRRILGDDSRQPHLIETIRKSGYRLMVPVRSLPDTATDTPATMGGTSVGTDNDSCRDPWEQGGLNRGLSRRTAIAVLAAAALILATATVVLIRDGRTRPTDLAFGVPFTSFPGDEVHPAISPDGTTVAFAWRRQGDDDYKLHLKQHDSESVLRLTDEPGHEYFPAWSPDGSRLAFVAHTEAGVRICTVSSIGGEVRRVSPLLDMVYGVDWSPDGKTLSFAAASEADQPLQLLLLDLDTRELRTLTSPLVPQAGDALPRFSPDGRYIAFLHSELGQFYDVYLVEPDRGVPHRVAHLDWFVRGLTWTSDGEALVVAAAPTGLYDLWRIDITGGKPELLPTAGKSALHPAIARHTGELVYQEHLSECDVWQCTLDAQPEESASVGSLIVSTRIDFGARIAPDGNSVLFVSERSGTRELWLADADGSSVRRLTSLQGRPLGTARWSPDSRHIAFAAAPAGHLQLFVVDVQSGESRQLTTAPQHHRLGHWSHDGQGLFCSVANGDRWQFLRVEVDDGTSRPVTTHGCLSVYESTQGELFYYKVAEPGIWRMSRTGEDETRVLSFAHFPGHRSLEVVPEGIYFTQRASENSVLYFLPAGTDVADTVAILPATAGDNLSVGPDRKRFTFDVNARLGNDLVLVSAIQ